MKQRKKKEERETVVCPNLGQTSTKYGVALCGVWGSAGKSGGKSIITYIQKRTYV